MAGRGVAGGRQYLRHLEPQEWNFAWRAHVGLRGEEADHAQLAFERAIAVVGLDADIVHVRAPVHAAHDIGLGDDQRRRGEVEAADLGRHGDELAAAPQYLDRGVAQHAKPTALAGEQIAAFGVAGELEFAHAEEGEVVLGEPIEKGQRFGAQIRGNGRADGVELGDRRLQPLPHLAPVADRNPDFAQDRRDRRHHFRAGAGGQGLEENGDIAFLMPVVPILITRP